MYSICAFSKRTTNTALSSVEHSLDTRSALLRPHTPTPNSFSSNLSHFALFSNSNIYGFNFNIGNLTKPDDIGHIKTLKLA